MVRQPDKLLAGNRLAICRRPHRLSKPKARGSQHWLDLERKNRFSEDADQLFACRPVEFSRLAEFRAALRQGAATSPGWRNRVTKFSASSSREIAVEAFFDEQEFRNSNASISDRFVDIRSPADRISLLQGDFFDHDRDDLAVACLVYDRASLIAMDGA